MAVCYSSGMDTHGFAGCIIADGQGRILVMHRPGADVWELPGGALEDDEPAEVAAARQAFEELGIDVEVGESLGSITFAQDGTDYEFTWFGATIEGGEPSPKSPEECDVVRYASRAELLALPNLSTALRQLLLDGH